MFLAHTKNQPILQILLKYREIDQNFKAFKAPITYTRFDKITSGYIGTFYKTREYSVG